mgnify:FL=1
MLKNINLFIVSLIAIEFFSLLLGYGTHFEHYKYAIMLSIVILNYLFIKRQSKLITLQQSHKKQK